MKENIALIREVFHRLEISVAENEAVEMLQKIGLEDIAERRQRECSSIQRFYVMLIRTMMSDEKKIIIRLPFSIVHSLLDINDLVMHIRKLDSKKDIIILDTIVHKSYYDKISDQKVVIDAL
ncbi:hypothetical protein [Sulfurimonas sp. C5]|uniref:hypothetical protein n=1 Tax=Sulfurimonas sp. C5 TaxID=3036947 RepID=UPI00245836A2|nr:hypothetical protein [Sulfurimonas sp. C5]MDH4944808.1 hypothetical protein [Sulfurimonas sp. C5]